MPKYHSAFDCGETVGLADRDTLQAFQRSWEWHHPLSDAQLAHAGTCDRIATVSYYHGGNPLYTFAAIPGIWHEACLRDTRLGESRNREAFIPAADYYTISADRRGGLPVVVVRDPSGREMLVTFQFGSEFVAENMRAVARVRTRIDFEHKYGFGGIYAANKRHLNPAEPGPTAGA
jgi:hypothetical protein